MRVPPTRSISYDNLADLQKRFAQDTAEHVITERGRYVCEVHDKNGSGYNAEGVLVSQQVFGCWRFGKPRTAIDAILINLWPGHIGTSGDRGSYSWSRVWDMTRFIPSREESLKYDVPYIAEKCQSIDIRCGFSQFDKRNVDEWVAYERQQHEESLADGEHDELDHDREKMEELVEIVKAGDEFGSEYEILRAAQRTKHWSDMESMPCSFDSYAWNYLWCVEAIRVFCDWHRENVKIGG